MISFNGFALAVMLVTIALSCALGFVAGRQVR